MSLKTSSIIWLIVLFILFILLALALVYVVKAEIPLPGTCSSVMKNQPSVKWQNECTYIQEIYPDSTLTTPTENLYLTSFSTAPNTPALGANVWYRYVYVRGDTGGYSAPSPWTVAPISAGPIANMPCVNGVGSCPSAVIPTGQNSCDVNVPTVAVSTLDYNISSGVYANVHRYVNPPGMNTPPPNTPNLTGEQIIGILYPGAGGIGGQCPDTSPTPCQTVINGITIQCNSC